MANTLPKLAQLSKKRKKESNIIYYSRDAVNSRFQNIIFASGL